MTTDKELSSFFLLPILNCTVSLYPLLYLLYKQRSQEELSLPGVLSNTDVSTEALLCRAPWATLSSR